MLEWTPRLALTLVVMTNVAIFLGSLVHIGTAGKNFGW